MEAERRRATRLASDAGRPAPKASGGELWRTQFSTDRREGLTVLSLSAAGRGEPSVEPRDQPVRPFTELPRFVLHSSQPDPHPLNCLLTVSSIEIPRLLYFGNVDFSVRASTLSEKHGCWLILQVICPPTGLFSLSCPGACVPFPDSDWWFVVSFRG